KSQPLPMNRLWISTLLLLVLVPFGQAQKATSAPAPLERGLEAIQQEHITSDLYFLADDVMGGRDTPSLEQKIAARYLRARLMRLGFQTGYKDSYLYPYELPRWGTDVEKTHMTLHLEGADFQWAWGKDYFHDSGSRSQREVQSAPVLYMGDVSDARDVDAEVAGCWIAVKGDRRASRKFRKELEEMGAIGIILVPEDEDASKVLNQQSRIFKGQCKPVWNEGPSPNSFASLILAENSAKAMRRAIGKHKPGERIDCKVSETCSVWSGGTTLENVVGIWPGSDPKLRNEVIIVSAHYDHVGKREDGTIYNGADDNGSGTSGLLGLCEGLAAYGPMRRTVMVMWVSAEEKGLWGSEAWTKNPWFPEGMSAVCNINIDMIGRNDPHKLNITPTRDHEEFSWLTRVAMKQCKEEGFPKLGSADDYYWRSDHASFRKNMGIPVIFLFADVHKDYHQPTDTVEKIDYGKITRVSRMVLRILDDIQGDSLTD
ncbi:MAG: M28 family peptidase, partial [Planctomycetes bacterium]|nr:M28 family peptidase [Planctomycetota bacterium]